MQADINCCSSVRLVLKTPDIVEVRSDIAVPSESKVPPKTCSVASFNSTKSACTIPPTNTYTMAIYIRERRTNNLRSCHNVAKEPATFARIVAICRGACGLDLRKLRCGRAARKALRLALAQPLTFFAVCF